MKQSAHKPSGFTPILILVIFLVLAGGALLLFSKYQLIPKTPTPHPTTITPTPNPTANWKLITRQNWQFKVPTNWNYWECYSGLLFVGPNIPSDQTQECAFDGSPGVVQVSRFYKSQGAVTRIPDENSTDPLVSDRSSTIVDGKQAIIQLEKILEGQGQGIRWIVYIQHAPDVLDIITLHDASQKPTFDQILSTFKFTESASTPSATPTQP